MQTNEQRGQYVVELDRPRLFTFTFNSMAALEAATGKKVVEIMETLDGKTPGFNDMITFTWAALLKDDENITIKQAGELLDLAVEMGKYSEVDEAIGKALSIFFEKLGVVGEDEKKNSTGPK
ncbi:hypothetical protein H1164_03560 [Thermoactinomyces daqus]|uniref:Uncharacterized protein n=1 Tax=Thermoactinomyces daqus TaxID=1329516 RepID=A0A7W2AHA8_9BACL|nr:hypothetical protein [Thermoactinomyces daqus]MBA4541980.1 hypothetical protein [Thermoactinomyces daqus]